MSEIFDFTAFFGIYSSFFKGGALPRIMNLRELVHISSAWKNFQFVCFDEIVKVVATIVQKEFCLVTDSEGGIRIPNKEGNDICSILYEILKQNGEPMHIDDIFNKFKWYFPEHKYTSSYQLRPSLTKDTRITHRNRNSTFMLIEWGDRFKTGTIRDAIIELLQREDSPQNIKAITKYVQSFFPSTNENSIRTTMLADSQKRFCQFSSSMFGLSSKIYSIDYKRDDATFYSKLSFEERLFLFVDFLEENERFPSSRNTANGESGLMAWWYRCINRQLKLTPEQQQQVVKVQKKYSHLRRHVWGSLLEDAKKFILLNDRLPSAKGEERRLYDWIRSNTKKFNDGELKLDDNDARRFVELMELLKDKGLK